MSRSRKKKPITGITTARTEKGYKVDNHRSERRTVRTALATHGDDSRIPHPKAFGNPWDGPKDGKIDWTGKPYAKKAIRK